ncbi:uncharacterized protein LOC122246999 isoform X2 [Penaeus japonicus]|uniref:uncharacterized protein LOC122246999 isoform X1 n=1 Tax=Penaeus japonicus TaxID=27405 RepID=UPI001C7173C5|nr:uncharacterized protein LOC122246999 isoform X1 [Penaeus japonicus]XP_042861850.1 uncharacterized protein LOC122246999 isoform X2 [Penaeus japonicus]
MASKQILILSVVVASIAAAPQFFADDQVPIPHDFAYGVEVADTGDAKEHKQSVSPSGRTEGEYRWLLPNGLFNVVRYYVDGDSGFQAEVSEEPGPAVGNYYTNSLSQQSASGVVSSSSQGFTRSFNEQQPSVGRTVNVISAPRPNQVTFSAPRLSQVFPSAPRPVQVSFTSAPRPSQVFSSVPAFNVQPQDFGGVIDGGFIDGGIIDDGIVSGGFQSSFDNSFDNSAIILARNGRFRG